MLIIVNYADSAFEEEAKRLIHKLCEDEKKIFIDLKDRVAFNSPSVSSLEFIALKNLFDTEVPELEKNVVLDGNVLFTLIENLDDFQRDFLFKQMDALGHVTANLVNKLEKKEDPFSFQYLVGKDFFVDFQKKLEPIAKKIEESPFYKLLKGINAYGFYLGTCDLSNPPSRIVVLPGGAGQKISYEEYANFVMSEIPLKEIEEKKLDGPEKNRAERFAYVRQHHTVELIAKKIAAKKGG